MLERQPQRDREILLLGRAGRSLAAPAAAASMPKRIGRLLAIPLLPPTCGADGSAGTRRRQVAGRRIVRAASSSVETTRVPRLAAVHDARRRRSGPLQPEAGCAKPSGPSVGPADHSQRSHWYARGRRGAGASVSAWNRRAGSARRSMRSCVDAAAELDVQCRQLSSQPTGAGAAEHRRDWRRSRGGRRCRRRRWRRRVRARCGSALDLRCESRA